jgi:hypothetical protein
MCPRRLHAEYTGAAGSGDPVNRARLRGAFLDAVRVSHAEGGLPRRDGFHVPGHLTEEEQRCFVAATESYLALYGDRPVTTHLHDCDRPTESPGRGVRIGGWVDLTVTTPDGGVELRQLDLWDGRSPSGDDPLGLESVWIAVLRLSRWVGDRRLVVSWADLVRGICVERIVDLRTELATLRDRFDDRLAVVRSRASPVEAVPGGDCGTCRHVWHCPAHPDGINVSARSGDLRPGVITITPTSLETWTRCPRAWRDQYLLALPAVGEHAASTYGQRAHDVLRFVHEHGSCHDVAFVSDVLDAHGAPDRLRDEVSRHGQRCPSPADAVGHELELARFHRSPWPPFMATARLDAVWVHDGLLDCRDYKTGRVWHQRVADDPRALVQAWVLAPLARERGLRLRLRYEHLASEIDEDPEPWELGLDDLADVGERLRTTVEAMRAETDWKGVADEMVCRSCRYRVICPDSRSAPIEPDQDPPSATRSVRTPSVNSQVASPMIAKS